MAAGEAGAAEEVLEGVGFAVAVAGAGVAVEVGPATSDPGRKAYSPSGASTTPEPVPPDGKA